jgi:hypothetical protein
MTAIREASIAKRTRRVDLGTKTIITSSSPEPKLPRSLNDPPAEMQLLAVSQTEREYIAVHRS